MRCKITTFSGKTKQNDEKTPQWVLFRGRLQKNAQGRDGLGRIFIVLFTPHSVMHL
jgi:hypothetical protein